jgi:hypothetical protein
VSYYAGLEARARYAEVLLAWQDQARLSALLAETARSPAHARRRARDQQGMAGAAEEGRVRARADAELSASPGM